jgi:hypothetical protein
MSRGASLEQAVADAIAALQWTHPLGPFTVVAARSHLLAACCREHRRLAEDLFSSGRLAS